MSEKFLQQCLETKVQIFIIIMSSDATIRVKRDAVVNPRTIGPRKKHGLQQAICKRCAKALLAAFSPVWLRIAQCWPRAAHLSHSHSPSHKAKDKGYKVPPPGLEPASPTYLMTESVISSLQASCPHLKMGFIIIARFLEGCCEG